MKDQIRRAGIATCVLTATLFSSACGTARARTIVVTTNGKHRLLREGKPYFIRGAGGDSRLAELAAAGGNSMRTWGAEDLERVLDEARSNGLTVCVGLWLGHERHGFDYQDEASVLRQLDACTKIVERYRHHPAVLMWGIGNEMEGSGRNPAVWYAVDHVAREVKRLDPDHPTMTVIAEIGDHKLRSIERFCPNIDIVGVNSYGGLGSLAERYRKAGGKKPYIVTEMGPLGPWESGKTSWGSPIEETSTAKGRRYAEGYRRSVAGQEGLCLGSYAFLWGHKQETTATWFGMLLPDGSRLAAADAMTEAWTGTAPNNRCPQIASLELGGPSTTRPGKRLTAKLKASDPEQDALSLEWVLRADSRTVGSGGDAQREEKTLSATITSSGMTASFAAPRAGGTYRLFAYVRDGHGGAAVANVPLLVEVELEPAPRAKLPFVIYGEANLETSRPPQSPYDPSGFMGNTAAIRVDPSSTDQPRSGKRCMRLEYRAADAWGGVMWQSPKGDWKGEKPGGLDLRGAVALEFWARGEKGGEVVNFVVGGNESGQQYHDTARSELKSVKLTREWKKLRIPLEGKSLRRIKTGFGWTLAGQGEPIKFFLDDIRYVAE